jgi:hypothetical protein
LCRWQCGTVGLGPVLVKREQQGYAFEHLLGGERTQQCSLYGAVK